MEGMDMDKKVKKADKMVKMTKVFMMLGILILLMVMLIEAFMIAPVSAQYWSNSKVDRDAAQPGSDILMQLNTLEQAKVIFPPIKFFGMGMLLAGITISLVAIAGILKMMPVKLNELMKKKG